MSLLVRHVASCSRRWTRKAMPLCFVVDAAQFLWAGIRDVPAPGEEIHGPYSLAVLTEARVL